MGPVGGAQHSYKTPSMAFLESKQKREEENSKQQQMQHPQSADFKKMAGPLSPISAAHNQTPNNMMAINNAASPGMNPN